MACLDLQYFSTLPHKWHDFRGGGLLNLKRVLNFSINLSETWLNLRRSQQDIIMILRGYSGDVPAILVTLMNLEFPRQIFEKILKYKIP